MTPVKVNIFISYSPEDKPQLNKLLKWLYPMRDEVNIRYNNPPAAPEQLSLPWQLLLFWYSPPDFRDKYRRFLHAQREKAHIYLFLTSYKSLSNKIIEDDIDVAVNRRIAGDNFYGPFVYPVILSPSRWKETSRLAAFKPLAKGTPLSTLKHEDEGYLDITEEIAELVKLLQSRLGEEKFYQGRNVAIEAGMAPSRQRAIPYLGESDEKMEFNSAPSFNPPEWLGWSILLFLFITVINALLPARVLRPSRYDSVKSADDHGMEYRREHPYVPTPDTIRIPNSE